ncbi:hypothetical protein C8A00DRAFT_31915 [Chaetomidium leptoderma]|uniref:Uncharacterized protein n=1 Tax=Chaetomidium leptoderma TaxID=669021 RepID=A0AAN6VRU9_9PEZI|nr:hypothetical protein C8A00DRAFT_31915 [Chaetomidium leptoderma]
MDCIRQEASAILALGTEHSEYTWPPRLVFKSPGLKPGNSTAFEHFYAGAYHSSTTVETWVSLDAKQEELGSVSIAQDFEMGETPSAYLRVIVVPCDGEKRHILYMDRAIFLELFSTLMLDEYALYLYLTNVPGLHFLGPRKPKAEHPPVLGFYLNAVDYTFIWSYNQRTQATNVLVIGLADGKWETNELLQAMMWNKGHILFNPLYLAFLTCFHGLLTTWECDAEFIPKEGVAGLKTTELNLDSNDDLVHFSKACLWFGTTLNNGERSLMILGTLRGIASQLDHTHVGSLWDESHGIIPTGGANDGGGGGSNDEKSHGDQSTDEIQAAMQPLQQQLASRVAHFEGRVRRAKIDLRLAMARMQRTEAGLAKRDSQTMVSIAFITMVFLPGTFIAALFDIQAPTEVIKSDFGRYWKLAVPLTVVVLLCWDVATRKTLQRRVLGPAGKG